MPMVRLVAVPIRFTEPSLRKVVMELTTSVQSISMWGALSELMLNSSSFRVIKSTTFAAYPGNSSASVSNVLMSSGSIMLRKSTSNPITMRSVSTMQSGLLRLLQNLCLLLPKNANTLFSSAVMGTFSINAMQRPVIIGENTPKKS